MELAHLVKKLFPDRQRLIQMSYAFHRQIRVLDQTRLMCSMPRRRLAIRITVPLLMGISILNANAALKELL